MADWTHWSSGNTRYTIGEIIERDVTMEGYDVGDRTDALRKEHERLVRILKVFADLVLTDEQEMTLGKALGYTKVEDR